MNLRENKDKAVETIDQREGVTIISQDEEAMVVTSGETKETRTAIVPIRQTSPNKISRRKRETAAETKDFVMNVGNLATVPLPIQTKARLSKERSLGKENPSKQTLLSMRC